MKVSQEFVAWVEVGLNSGQKTWFIQCYGNDTIGGPGLPLADDVNCHKAMFSPG